MESPKVLEVATCIAFCRDDAERCATLCANVEGLLELGDSPAYISTWLVHDESQLLIGNVKHNCVMIVVEAILLFFFDVWHHSAVVVLMLEDQPLLI